jgi:hypothetical protein
MTVNAPAPPTPDSTLAPPRPLPWRLEDIAFDAIDTRVVRDDETLFYLLVSASFIETASDLYTRNLLGYYGGDPDAADWLANHWEHEEVQHGRALRAYVAAVWPAFAWAEAYRRFFAEYSFTATPDAFERSRALELAARCMIETGTATYYRMLHDYAAEPVLRRILDHIRTDEVRHFKHFLGYFRAYEARERNGRLRTLVALARRLHEAKGDDGWIAFRHAFEVRHHGRACTRADYAAWTACINRVALDSFPFMMAAQMLLSPLALRGRVRALLARALEAGLRRFMFA